MSKKVVIFTPTQRPGIDVTLASVARQVTDADILWVLADQLHSKRWNVMQNLMVDYRGKFEFKHIYTPRESGRPRNLAKVYNIGLDIAREEGADLFVSLQDYIWAPPSGVQRFLDLDEDGKSNALFTGLTHISSTPPASAVYDLDGMHTIFDKAYNDCPTEIGWTDVRDVEDAPPLRLSTPIQWETNYAAVGRAALYDEDLYFDEDYDLAVAYENQDYAYRASQLGYKLVLDCYNQACSLPHKEYWPDEWASEEPLTKINQTRSEQKWGTP